MPLRLFFFICISTPTILQSMHVFIHAAYRRVGAYSKLQLLIIQFVSTTL